MTIKVFDGLTNPLVEDYGDGSHAMVVVMSGASPTPTPTPTPPPLPVGAASEAKQETTNALLANIAENSDEIELLSAETVDRLKELAASMGSLKSAKVTNGGTGSVISQLRGIGSAVSAQGLEVREYFVEVFDGELVPFPPNLVAYKLIIPSGVWIELNSGQSTAFILHSSQRYLAARVELERSISTVPMLVSGGSIQAQFTVVV